MTYPTDALRYIEDAEDMDHTDPNKALALRLAIEALQRWLWNIGGELE